MLAPAAADPVPRSSTCKPQIPEAWFLPRELHQLAAQGLVRASRLIAVTRNRQQAACFRSLKAYSCFICPIAAFSATSSSRFFGSPTATPLCPESDLPPASAGSCSHRATASLPTPGSHPCHRTSPSRHRSCASIPPLPAPHLPPCVRPTVVSVPRSSGASVCLLLDIPSSPFFRTKHTQLCAETGEQVNPMGLFFLRMWNFCGLLFPS